MFAALLTVLITLVLLGGVTSEKLSLETASIIGAALLVFAAAIATLRAWVRRLARNEFRAARSVLVPQLTESEKNLLSRYESESGWQRSYSHSANLSELERKLFARFGKLPNDLGWYTQAVNKMDRCGLSLVEYPYEPPRIWGDR